MQVDREYIPAAPLPWFNCYRFELLHTIDKSKRCCFPFKERTNGKCVKCFGCELNREMVSEQEQQEENKEENTTAVVLSEKQWNDTFCVFEFEPIVMRSRVKMGKDHIHAPVKESDREQKSGSNDCVVTSDNDNKNSNSANSQSQSGEEKNNDTVMTATTTVTCRVQQIRDAALTTKTKYYKTLKDLKMFDFKHVECYLSEKEFEIAFGKEVDRKMFLTSPLWYQQRLKIQSGLEPGS